MLKLFYIFGDAVNPDGRISGEQMYGIDYLRAILFSHDHPTYAGFRFDYFYRFRSLDNGRVVAASHHDNITKSLDLLII